MNEYLVTARVTREKLMRFIDEPGAQELTITAIPVQETPAESPMLQRAQARQAAFVKRGPRGSKVNDTILQALGSGNKTIKELKAALEARELAPGSLSTGLAALQKAALVKRIEDGLYGLAHEPALQAA
jgi:hypothetical protein